MGLRDQGLILRVARICGSRVEGFSSYYIKS